MNVLDINLSKDFKGIEFKSIEILIFADEHDGDTYSDTENLKKRIEYVRKTPNAFAIINGDIMNNATRNSKSDVYTEKKSPTRSLFDCIDLFEPIKDKILSIVEGNHCERTYKVDGLSLMAVFAKSLKIMHRYSPVANFIFLRFGRESRGRKNSKGEVRGVCYTIYTTHGNGGGRMEGSKVNALSQLSNIVDADIYIHSHTHLPVSFAESFYRVDVSNSTITSVNKLFVNNAANLDYGGYGEQFKFKPSCKKSPVIHLNGEKKEMESRLTL